MREKLDMVVGDPSWNQSFPEASVIHLPALKSNHKAILLRTSLGLRDKGRTRMFRVMASWMADDSLNSMLKKTWDSTGEWKYLVTSFQLAFDDWNNNCYGNLFHRKIRILARLHGINEKLTMEENCVGSVASIT